MTTQYYFGKTKLNKQGFTLMEMLVVLVLLAVVSVMVATFSHSMGNFASVSEREYSFLQDCARARQDVSDWLYAVDKSETVLRRDAFSFSEDKALLYDGNIIGTYGDIDAAEFSVSNDNKIIKFALVYYHNGKPHEYSFVIAPRCAQIEVTT